MNLDITITSKFAAALNRWLHGPHKGLPDEVASNVKYITAEDDDERAMTTVFDTLQDEVVALFPKYSIAVRSDEQKAD